MTAMFQAYDRLETCRTSHGDIPWTAIDSYARRYGIEDIEALEDCIYGFERVRRAVEKDRQPAGNSGQDNARKSH